jgi:glycosyltransferase involved in cell wall biosynthesis
VLRVRDFLHEPAIHAPGRGSKPPLVSVVLPTYRRRGSLGRAMESVLAQGVDDLELIVMDDGSTDGSAELIAALQARDPRVVHVRHERNCGLPALRVNEGIELARGRYVAFQFDDDTWRPKALESLVAAAAGCQEPTVIVGRALFTGRGGEWKLPAVELSLVTLYEQNRLANNAVLVPREIFDRHGMYDCHIGMRRLSDWDLWLRLIKHVPFVAIDEVITDVHEGRPGALGLTVPWDLPLFRFLHDVPRDALLTPACWRDYSVDALRVGGVEVPKDLRRRLWEEHVVTYYFRFRHVFPRLEGFSATLPPRPRNVMYTKAAYDVSNDVTLNHYDALMSRRGTGKAHFEPLTQAGPDWKRDSDALLLVRTVEDQAVVLLDRARRESAPVGLYLDDDLLSFHEYGPEFRYLAPGTPYHRNLSTLLEGVDAVWVTNGFIEESVRAHSTRVIPHNNAVPADALPVDVPVRDPQAPFRVGYVGSGYRKEEFERIWKGLQRFSEEHGDRVTFEFWGLDVGALPRLASPVVQRPFTFSYPLYLRRLREAGFDVLLCPLLDRPRPRLGKSLIKYYESAVAGALGIFSDVPPYASLPAGLTCLKAANEPAAWHEALTRALTMPREQLDLLRRRAIAHVRDEFTDAAQIHKHEAAWRATEFHGLTRRLRHADGRPRVVYALHSVHFGGGEIQLWRRLRLARRYAIEPIVVLPRVTQPTEAGQRLERSMKEEGISFEFVDYTCLDRPRGPEQPSSLQSREVRELLERTGPALVHSVTFIPAFGQVCREMGIPHVSSLYAIDDAFAWLGGRPDLGHAQVVQSDCLRYARRWSELLGTEPMCAREVVPEEVFAFGLDRYLEGLGREAQPWRPPVRLVVTGTIQERKRQLETIRAVAALVREGFDFRLDIFGYTHFFPEYMEGCRREIARHGLADQVAFRGFEGDPLRILRSADVVLSLSTFESFPSAIKEALASGVLVVATPVGGIPELIVDGVTGILCSDTSVAAMTDGIRRALHLAPAERERIVAQARRVARSEFHPSRAMSDMLSTYLRALELSEFRRASPERPLPRSVPAPVELGRIEYPRSPPVSHVLLKGPVSYRLQPSEDGWTGLDILVGTHEGTPTGLLVLRVFSDDGGLLREASADLSLARDNDWLSFRFGPIEGSRQRPFRLRFALFAPRGTRISIYETNREEARAWRALRRTGVPVTGNQLYCRTWHSG